MDKDIMECIMRANQAGLRGQRVIGVVPPTDATQHGYKIITITDDEVEG